MNDGNETDISSPSWIEAVAWGPDGLVAAIAQEATTGEVLMLAWMSRVSLAMTVDEGRAVYWSRSRKCLWRKGESSGHVQRVIDLRLDCDGDAILLKVEQLGGIACHTGRHRCFYRQLKEEAWCVTDPVLKPSEDIYGHDADE